MFVVAVVEVEVLFIRGVPFRTFASSRGAVDGGESVPSFELHQLSLSSALSDKRLLSKEKITKIRKY